MRINIDSRDLRKLELDLNAAPLRLKFQGRKVMERWAEATEREMSEDARGARRSDPTTIPHLPKSSSHTVVNDLTAEVGLGPRRGTQGSLAHIIAYGSVNNAPVYDYFAGPRRAQRRFTTSWLDAMEDSIGEGS